MPFCGGDIVGLLYISSDLFHSLPYLISVRKSDVILELTALVRFYSLCRDTLLVTMNLCILLFIVLLFYLLKFSLLDCLIIQ